MPRSFVRIVLLGSAMSLMFLTACGGSGTARLQLSKVTAGAPLRVAPGFSEVMSSFPDTGTALTPTVFQMKFVQAYLSEDIDANQNNVGKVARVWVHPDCSDPNSCSDAQVGFFDLIDPTAANEKLNSQNATIDVGTYRYVKIDFCVGAAAAPNVKYQAGTQTEPVLATYGGCGVTSAKMDPPVELKSGETVTIALDYDLTKMPIYKMGSGDCSDATPCLGGIELTPRIVR